MSELEYFTIGQEDQFTFYRIPKALITDKRYSKISCEAKMLYGLMLDRVSLSRKNNWVDDLGRLYIIFPVGEIKEDLNCAKDKAYKMIAELDQVGLIKRCKRGQGRSDLIYVKNFSRTERSDGENAASKVYEKNGFKNTEKTDSEEKCTEKTDSGILEKRILECGNSGDKYINNNIYNNTDSINPLQEDEMMDEIDRVRESVEDQIDYSELMITRGSDRKLINTITGIIAEMLTIPRKTVTIHGTSYPWIHVKKRFEKLRYNHVYHVIGMINDRCRGDSASPVKNINAYLTTCLFDVVETMDAQQDIRFMSTYRGA